MKITSSSRILCSFCAVFIAATLAGCGKSEEKAAPPPPVVVVVPVPTPTPTPAPAPAAPARVAPPVAAVAPKPEPKPAAAPPAPAKHAAVQDKNSWQLLGQQTAAFKSDRGRIVVGKAKGAFRELQIRVEDAPLNLESVVVTFGNGKQFKPDIQHQFSEKSNSRAIDLPGEKHAIQQVDFVYRSANRREGAATVQLYGR